MKIEEMTNELLLQLKANSQLRVCGRDASDNESIKRYLTTAYKRGQENMRERAVMLTAYSPNCFSAVKYAQNIRDLPIKEE